MVIFNNVHLYDLENEFCKIWVSPRDPISTKSHNGSRARFHAGSRAGSHARFHNEIRKRGLKISLLKINSDSPKFLIQISFEGCNSAGNNFLATCCI